MKTFDQALFDLYEQGHISYEDALRNADSKNELRLRVKLESKRENKPVEADGDLTASPKKPRARASSGSPCAADPLEITGSRVAAGGQHQAAVQADGGAARRRTCSSPRNAPIKIKIEGQIYPDQQAGAAAGGGALDLLRPDDARSRSSTSSASWRSISRSPSPGWAASASTSSISAAIRPWCCATSPPTCRGWTARAAGHAERLSMLQARPDPDGRGDRLGQVDHAGGDDQPPQRELRPTTSSRSRIRSSSCTPTSARSSISARSASIPRATSARCAA